MMKTKYLLAATLFAGLASCGNDETGNTDNTGTQKDTAALFTGSIEGTRARAYDQTWDPEDMIGISGTSGTKTYTNICYKRAGSGSEAFTAADETRKIYYQDEQPVTFTAYYPWNESLTAATTITADTREQMNQKQFDFLYSTAAGSQDTPVNFTFAHKMAKLVLTVKAGAAVVYSDVESAVCSLEGFLNEGTFDRATGIAAASGTPGAMWTFANNTSAPTYNTPTIKKNEAAGAIAYTLILFPQTFPSSAGNLKFTAATAGKAFSAEIDLSKVPDNDDANELKAGVQYNITINLNKTGLTVGVSTISPWEEKSHEINAGM